MFIKFIETNIDKIIKFYNVRTISKTEYIHSEIKINLNFTGLKCCVENI